MITIKRSTNKKYMVVVTGSNGEILSTSELLNSKQAAWRNINAQIKVFEDYEVIDNSAKSKK